MVYNGDALSVLKQLDSESVQCCITSPPYFNLRDYGVDGQIGLEDTPEEFIAKLAEVFHEVKRVLKPDGTLWVNIADSYAGSGKGRNAVGRHSDADNKNTKQSSHKGSVIGRLKKTVTSEDAKPKDLLGIPWMLAFALRADGWYLRSDIIWEKPNAMPESVKDRPTRSHEYIFLLSKSRTYYYDYEVVMEDAVGYNNAEVAGSEGTLRPIQDGAEATPSHFVAAAPIPTTAVSITALWWNERHTGMSRTRPVKETAVMSGALQHRERGKRTLRLSLRSSLSLVSSQEQGQEIRFSTPLQEAGQLALWLTAMGGSSSVSN